MKRTLATTTTVALALAIAAVPDLAVAGDRASSTISITSARAVDDGVRVRGKVASDAASCEKGRTVKVFHDVAPPGPSSEDFLLGTVRTNRYGKWRLTTPHAPDKVYATVRGNDGCRADTSPTRTVTD